MALKTTHIERIGDTQNGFALYELEMFTTAGESVGEIMLRAELVDGKPDETEKDDVIRVLRREATRRGYPVASE